MRWLIRVMLACLTLTALIACVSKPQESIKTVEISESVQMQKLFADDVISLQTLGAIPGPDDSSKVFQQDTPKGIQVIAKIMDLLNSAKLTHGEHLVGKHGYAESLQIKFKNGLTAEIEPAYKCTITTNADGSGTKTCPQLENEVLLSYGSKYSWLKSPELYAWLHGGWKQDNSN
jgi:hypothetical protein